VAPPLLLKKSEPETTRGMLSRDDNALTQTAFTMSLFRSFIPSPVQLVGKDLKEQDKDAEHGNIDKRVEMGVTMIGGLDEIVAIGKR
jgi:hypothetical protein